MADPIIAAGGTEVLVEDFYRELAEERAGRIRLSLSAEPAERSLSQSAEAFERAAAALQHLRTLAPVEDAVDERLADHAAALVLMAARFEQSADLARHLASARRPRP